MKKILSVLITLLLVLAGCGQSKESAIKEYTSIMEKFEKVDSYSISKEYDVLLETTGSDSGSSSYTEFVTQRFADLNKNPSMYSKIMLTDEDGSVYLEIWFADDQAYLDLNGDKSIENYDYATLLSEIDSVIDAIDYTVFTTDDIDSVAKEKSGALTSYSVTIKEDVVKKYMLDYLNSSLEESFTADETNIVVKTATQNLVVDANDTITEMNLEIDFEATIYEVPAHINITVSGNVSDIDNTVVEMPDANEFNTSSPNVDINSLDDFKEYIVSDLDYVVQADGTYMQDYGNSEHYYFDFANTTYIYEYDEIKYYYNYSTNIANVNACRYDIKNSSVVDSSSCSDEEISDLEYTATSLDYDLSSVGVDISILFAK